MPMTKKEWDDLKPGDVVSGDASGVAYVVHGRTGIDNNVLLVRTQVATSPKEWTLEMKKAV